MKDNDKREPRSYTLGYILKGFPRISETFITNEILALERLGYRIKIFSLRLPYDPKTHPNVARVKADLHYLPEYVWKKPLPIFASNLRVMMRYPRGYFRSLIFASIRGLKRWSYHTLKRLMQAGYLVDHFYRAGTIQHWHSHFAHGPTTTAMFASWITGIPYSFTAHAKDIYTQAPDFIQKKLAHAQFAVTCTGYNLAYLNSLNQSDTPIHKNYHGIDLSDFKNGEWKPAKEDAVTIVTVGRLVEKKGYPVMLKALAELRKNGIRFRSLIIGTGPLKEELKALRDELALTRDVSFLGQMSHQEVKELYREADLFVLSPHIAADGDRDGIPNVLVEAMAMGLPVVSTRISGIPELVRDGENGLLVDPQNPQALAKAIQKLIENPDLRKRFAQNARNSVLAEFDFHKNTERLGQLFDRAVSEK